MCLSAWTRCVCRRKALREKTIVFCKKVVDKTEMLLYNHPCCYRCGNSSVGRAQPCQGWGREFESRFPLHANPSRSDDRDFLLPGKPFLKETVRLSVNLRALCRFHRNFSFARGFFVVFACQIEYVVILYCSIVKMGWFLYPKIYRVITNSNIY